MENTNENNEDQQQQSTSQFKSAVVSQSDPQKQDDEQIQQQQQPLQATQEEETKQSDFSQLQNQTNQNQQQQDNQSEIQVSISDPIQKDGSMGKYIVYKVSGEDKDGVFEQYRRFNDFFTLRTILVQRWPACYIPPTPPKKAVGNMDQQFIEDRRNLLDIFMKKLAQFQHIWYCEEVKLFIRSTAPDIDRLLNNLPKQDHSMLISKYEQSFKQLSGKEINTELIIKINAFSSYLKKIGPMLENFKGMAQNMSNQRKMFNDQLQTFVTYLLPDYEKNCQSEYANNNLEKKAFFDLNSENLTKFQSQLKDYQNHSEFDSLYQLIRYELKEVEAFQEAMKAKEDYENLKLKAQQKHKDLQIELQKVMAGKTTVKTFFSSKTKDESAKTLQDLIDAANKDIESLTLICDIMTVILGYIEIDNFKLEKEQKYYNVIKNLSKYEAEYSKLQQEFWNTILENPTISNQQ